MSRAYTYTTVFILVCAALVGAVLLWHVPAAQAAGALEQYVPLSPLPGGTVVDTSDPTEYFSNAFNVAVAIAAVLAVLMLMLCGFQYMTTDAITGKQSAKRRCWMALLGLLLVLASYLLLFTINPDLVNLPFDRIREAVQQNAALAPVTTSAPSGELDIGGTIATNNAGNYQPSFTESVQETFDRAISTVRGTIDRITNSISGFLGSFGGNFDFGIQEGGPQNPDPGATI